jgi:integrase
VIRVVVLCAAMTGLRQAELLGLRWRDVDWTAQRIRVRNAWVRGEHSAEGKSDPLDAPLRPDGRPARTRARPVVAGHAVSR